MRKDELIGSVSATTGIPKNAVEAVINATLETIVSSVAEGDEVNITNFGKFYRSERKERGGINPQSGERITIPAKNSPAFRPGVGFKEKVSG